MIYWPHSNLDAPPRLEDLRYRRPTSGEYWESPAGSKSAAIQGFWLKWQRVTGKPLPGKLPPSVYTAGNVGFAGSQLQASRQPRHISEKKEQDLD